MTIVGFPQGFPAVDAFYWTGLVAFWSIRMGPKKVDVEYGFYSFRAQIDERRLVDVDPASS